MNKQYIVSTLATFLIGSFTLLVLGYISLIITTLIVDSVIGHSITLGTSWYQIMWVERTEQTLAAGFGLGFGLLVILAGIFNTVLKLFFQEKNKVN